MHSITDIDKLYEIAEQLSKQKVDNITRTGSGRNSRIFKVKCGNMYFALKFYRPHPENLHNRLNAESQALQLFEEHGIKSIPHLIAVDIENNCSLLEWIDGSPINHVTEEEIEVASNFLKKLHGLRKIDTADKLPSGTEACLSGFELFCQVNNRLHKLKKSAENHLLLREFVEKDFAPVVEIIGSWCKSSYVVLGLDFSKEIDRSFQTLSPVDFGFHNTLRIKNGNIIFLDFEYFGWADPVNLISDTLLHPGMTLQEPIKKLFYKKMLELYGGNRYFLERLKILYPLYGLRWCAIMLNQFLPGYVSLEIEGLREEDKRRIEEERLNRVRNFTQEIYRTYQDFPYDD